MAGGLYQNVGGIALIDIVFPIIAWSVIFMYYVYQFYRRKGYKNWQTNPECVKEPGFKYSNNYFFHMRGGWVRRNKLTGQGSANSTRDFLRVLIFFAGNSALVTFVFGGYLASRYDSRGGATPYDNYVSIKLGAVVVNFLATFWLFLYSIRYETQHHFMMNVEEVNNGIPMNNKVSEKMFHLAHFYYAAGLRMYYVCLPLFAWFVSSWVLLFSVPIFLYIVEEYEDMSVLEEELENMYRGSKYAKPSMVAEDEAAAAATLTAAAMEDVEIGINITSEKDTKV